MRARLRMLLIALSTAVAAAGGCKRDKAASKDDPSAGAAKSAADNGTSRDAAFTKRADEFYKWFLDTNPGRASELGYHEYDGALPDLSPATLERNGKELDRALADFGSMTALSKERDYERQILLANIREALFALRKQRSPYRNPMGYMWGLSFTRYISRDYAPVGDRARAMVETCKLAARYLEQARKNLEPKMPRTWIETALLQTNGLMAFMKNDVIAAMTGLGDAGKKELEVGLGACLEALATHRVYLQERKKEATDDFALGESLFLEMLAAQGLEIDLARLEAVGAADLERNRASLAAAAKKIDATKTIAEVVAQVASDKPAPDEVLAEATAQSAEMKKFLIDKEIVTIPSDEIAEVVPTPPFMRFNFAFLDSAGAFEKRKLPSFYYISPPDPSWPKQVQENYLASRADLLFVTIHEVWPGHFLHHLHSKESTSKIARSMCNYPMSEGWAHYTEEMMWDAGVGAGDPAIHIGQLQNALLRNVRYVSAIGLHTKGMTVEESRKMFIEKGMQDEGNATQQAVRGTFDPGYLNYTLGKLMIRKLHGDWKAKMGDEYSLEAFHDQFLAYQCAPVPVIRTLMLGEESGSPL